MSSIGGVGELCGRIVLLNVFVSFIFKSSCCFIYWDFANSCYPTSSSSGDFDFVT